LGVLGAAVRPTCESQITQSSELRFRALLTENGVERVELVRT
jgi:hypothetical protein